MLIAFAPVTASRSTRDRIDSVAWDAMRALGELTTLANFAEDTEMALLIHARANELRAAVLSLEDIAITKSDRLCGQ